MDKAYYLTDPSAIDERYFQKVLQSPCNGVAVKDAATGEVLCYTYSAFVLAIITRAHGDLDGVFWTHGGGLLPLKEFALAYKAGYADGRNTFFNFAEEIKNGEMSAAEFLKIIHRKGREAKAKCAAPLPLSIGRIRETGFHTGQAVEASSIMHQNPAVFEQAFGIPLACAPGWCVFEFAEPLDCKPLISIMDADTGTRFFDLSAKTPVDRERQSIQMHCFIGNQKRAFAEAREHLVSEAERYNRTDAIVRGYPVNEKAFAEHTLQNNYEVTIRMELLPGNKVKLNLDESLHVPPYIGVGQAIKYHGYMKKQAEAAEKEFLQNGMAAEGETPNCKLSNFLTDDGARLTSFILKNYEDARPERIAALILALLQLELAKKSILDNKAQLYKALCDDKLIKGTEQGFKQSLQSFYNGNKESLIGEAKSMIKKYNPQ